MATDKRIEIKLNELLDILLQKRLKSPIYQRINDYYVEFAFKKME